MRIQTEAMKKEDILYEDNDIIVCHKKAGIATQTARAGEPDMVSMLKNYLKSPYLAVVHRLDQPVEGILVFAKSQRAAASLSSQNAKQSMSKKYYAVAVLPSAEAAEESSMKLTDYLLKDGKTNTSKVVRPGQAGAKAAELTYKFIKALEQEEAGVRTLMCIQLKTGRHHQIRVQMAHAGMPLLGDFKYGSEEARSLSLAHGIRHVALCAYQLEFSHPVTGKRMEFAIEPANEAFSSFFPINS